MDSLTKNILDAVCNHVKASTDTQVGTVAQERTAAAAAGPHLQAWGLLDMKDHIRMHLMILRNLIESDGGMEAEERHTRKAVDIHRHFPRAA